MRTIGAALLLGAGWHIWATPKSERDVIPDFGAQKHGVCRNFYAALKPRFFLFKMRRRLYMEI